MWSEGFYYNREVLNYQLKPLLYGPNAGAPQGTEVINRQFLA